MCKGQSGCEHADRALGVERLLSLLSLVHWGSYAHSCPKLL